MCGAQFSFKLHNDSIRFVRVNGNNDDVLSFTRSLTIFIFALCYTILREASEKAVVQRLRIRVRGADLSRHLCLFISRARLGDKWILKKRKVE